MAIKILVKLSQDEHPTSGEVFGVLDIQAHQIGPGERKEIRDEIAALAPGGDFKEIDHIHLDTDSLIAQIKGANEETVRRFEEAGWTWYPEEAEEAPEGGDRHAC
jgi:hypothetical protein